MAERILVDAGPLVAFLNGSDQHHAWARQQFGQIEPPMLTCEAVLSEAQFLVARGGGEAHDIGEEARRGD